MTPSGYSHSCGVGSHGRRSGGLSLPLNNIAAFTVSPNFTRWGEGTQQCWHKGPKVRWVPYSGLTPALGTCSCSLVLGPLHQVDRRSWGDGKRKTCSYTSILPSTSSPSTPKKQRNLVGTFPWPAYVECEHALMKVCEPALHNFISSHFRQQQ